MAGREEADWKNQRQKLLDVVVILVALAMIAAYVYRGLTADRSIYLGFAAFLLIMFVAYFSSFWQPILYLIGVVVVVAFSTVLLIVGFWAGPLDFVALTLNGIFILLSIYLFVKEEVWV